MAISSFDIGNAAGGGAATISFSPSVDIPATDLTNPAAGATLVFVFVQTADAAVEADPLSVFDDTSGANTCFLGNDLNHYLATFVSGTGFAFGANFSQLGFLGIAMNPILAGINNITCTLSDVPSFASIYGRAYSGVQVDLVGPQADTFLQANGAGDPLGAAALADGSNSGIGAVWNYVASAVSFLQPPGSSGPTDWEWSSGDLAVYLLNSVQNTPGGSWAWTSGAIATQFEDDDINTAVGAPTYFSNVYAEEVIAGLTPVVGRDLSGAWSGGSGAQLSTSLGGAFALRAGLGPTCLPTPPPGGGIPILHGHVRLSE